MLYALILYTSGGTYTLKSTPNDRFLRSFFMAGLFALKEFLPDICWEEVAEDVFSYYFHILLDYVDFKPLQMTDF